MLIGKSELVLTFKLKVLRDMPRCSAVNVYRRFGRTRRIHLVRRGEVAHNTGNKIHLPIT